MKSADFRSLPGFSKLFIDFVNEEKFFNERFNTLHRLVDSPELIDCYKSSPRDRNALTNAAISSIGELTMSNLQLKNLDLLSRSDSLTVITGQQIGFLGGPEYIILKAMGAIALADRLRSIHPETQFVPVFWVEDNDHDALEASVVSLLTGDFDIEEFRCLNANPIDKFSVSEFHFDESIGELVRSFIAQLPQSPYKAEIADKLRSIYVEGKSWTVAYIELLQSWLQDYGILFIRASHLRKAGLFDKFALKELTNIGTSDYLVGMMNEVLQVMDYHIQAKSNSINLFYHHTGQRLKLAPIDDNKSLFMVGSSTYDYHQLIELAKSETGAFSPNVMLRPIFQDGIFPNCAYIAGPSEIGYSAQLRENYRFFGVEPSAYVARPSATAIVNNVNKFLNKESIEPEYFYRDFAQIELELSEKLLDYVTKQLIEDGRHSIGNTYGNIAELFESQDPGISRSGEAFLKKSLKLFANFEKKIKSHNKKANSQIFQKYRNASNLIYPKNTLQERIFTPLSFMTISGEKHYLSRIYEAASKENTRHYYIDLI